jgi:biotin carboxylase
MRPHLLLIGGNDSSALHATPLDADVTLFQRREQLTDGQVAAARRVVVFDYERLDETVALAKAIHAVHPFQAAVSFWERALLAASVTGEVLGIKANPARAVRLTRDKLLMRARLATVDADPVPWRLCETRQDVGRFLREVGGPIVLKPTQGAGSAGVALVSSERDLASAWTWALGADLLPLFAEAYLDGPEFSVESLTIDGRHRILGITEKFTSGPPHFVETGHRFPADLPAGVTRRIHASVIGLLDAVDHTVGPAHTEVRVTPRGPRVIETQTRFGGDQIWRMVQIVTGIDLVKHTCASLLGLPVPAPQPHGGGAAVRFLADEHCTIESAAGLDDARAVEGVVHAECSLEPGTVLGPLTASKARQGLVLAWGTSGAQAWDIAGRALSRIRIARTGTPETTRGALAV